MKKNSYVTQDDSLIGCFTVRETLGWAVELNLPSMPKQDRNNKIESLLIQFGLVNAVLSIAVQLVKEPRVMFLDEPTSGLDSAASFKVMESIKNLAAKNSCPVVCSIHQPSPSTYRLFDKVLFLARGNTIYFGKNDGSEVAYFNCIGHEIPAYVNVPDAVLDYVNVDFLGDEAKANQHIDTFVSSWQESGNHADAKSSVDMELKKPDDSITDAFVYCQRLDYVHSCFKQVEILIRRNFSNALKNILMFWMRLILYVAMAVLMGTTWFQLSLDQGTVQPRLMAIFLSIAFLGFMAVAGIPAVLEERLVFKRERLNRTYSVGAYVVANTLTSVPFVLLLAFGFSTPFYFLSSFHGGASHFFKFVLFFWLALYVAESFTVLIAAVFPIFVVALTVASLFGGIEMVTHGFLVNENIPAFWKYTFTYWNYQKWAWKALVGNEFSGLTFTCAPIANSTACFCLVPSSGGADACTFSGEDVLLQYGYSEFSYALSAVCLVALVLFYRVLFYVALRLHKPKA
ncbi:hypothetical protein HDU98_008138 [Podochytrium sp. JEL0797]|nr:hypothetical protein HDU98_008138 [Podochytrium sp. JEL0797]